MHSACSACGATVPVGGAFCPQCGKTQRVQKSEVRGVFNPQDGDFIDRAPRWLKITIRVITLGIITPLLIAMMIDIFFIQSEDETRIEHRRDWRTKSIVVGQERVRRLLRDPESAEFRNVVVIEATNQNYDYAGTLCGEVNSKNGFGGYVGFRSFVVVGSLAMLDEGQEAFKRVWAQTCS